MNGAQQQQSIFTIQEQQQQLNNGTRRTSNSDLLIDTNLPPLSQQPLAPMPNQHQHAGYDSQAITSQPGGPASSARVAPENQNIVYSVHPVFGLLDQHEALLVRQRAEPASTCCGFESANSYTVRAKDGSPLLKAVENSNCCERCCFEGNREYNLSLVHGDEIVARIRKAHRISRFCCYSNAVRIESPEDNPIGQVKQMFSLFGHPRYAIFDCQQPAKVASFFIESTSCRYCCTPLLCTCLCGIREFRIVSLETREQVGTISRRWADSAQPGADQQPPAADQDEPFGGGQADQLFGIQFTANLEARHKVLLLSACFMLDFFYFENDRRRRKLASC